MHLSKSLPIAESAGHISSEFVMCYPPGIPILAPGERITEEILDFIQYSKDKGCFLTGTEDSDIENINVLKESDGMNLWYTENHSPNVRFSIESGRTSLHWQK